MKLRTDPSKAPKSFMQSQCNSASYFSVEHRKSLVIQFHRIFRAKYFKTSRLNSGRPETMLTKPMHWLAKAASLSLALAAVGSASANISHQQLQVFILAGQSNMQGHARWSTVPGMLADPSTEGLYHEIVGPDGKAVICPNVWITSIGCGGNQYSDMLVKNGHLTSGFGASSEEIGPEFTFGVTMEKLLHKPILIIKTSWGGRSLMTDFRPPSAGPRTYSDYIVKQWKSRHQDPASEEAKSNADSGVFYHHMIDYVHSVLKNIGGVDPEYDAKAGYRLAGFVWFQGFNDFVDSWGYPDQRKPSAFSEYTNLLNDLVSDVRLDLSAPALPVVIGVMGISGNGEGAKPPQLYFREAQTACAANPKWKGTVVAVPTAPYWDNELDALQQSQEMANQNFDRFAKANPYPNGDARRKAHDQMIASVFNPTEREKLTYISNGGYHYLGAAKILAPIGKAFALAMAKLLK